ncbi:hypothetical protein QBC40DRAFT_277210 [Triangularia verruculosa]|uniref:Uncharacterized protein n=1 Tax=Triangularia verruculosa TaxID=2587418 RepID=A0AAN7AUU5_9PEZI|nr:hypothetical protein QBC40DRAFT_277210 [Triangularia verruculosa]
MCFNVLSQMPWYLAIMFFSSVAMAEPQPADIPLSPRPRQWPRLPQRQPKILPECGGFFHLLLRLPCTGIPSFSPPWFPEISDKP